MIKLFSAFFLVLLSLQSIALPTPNIKGVVTDYDSNSSILSRTDLLVNTNSLICTATNSFGHFINPNILMRWIDLQVTKVRYETNLAIFYKSIVNSANQTFLPIKLNKNIFILNELLRNSRIGKEQQINMLVD